MELSTYSLHVYFKDLISMHLVVIQLYYSCMQTGICEWTGKGYYSYGTYVVNYITDINSIFYG